MSTAGRAGILPRASIDYGDIERHDSGEVAGPPVRRGAGLVAAAHPGQVLLSAEANQALSATGASGSLVRSLGTHRIQGVEASQPIFQVVLAGHDGDFPPLQLDANPPPLPADRRAVAGYELREPIISDLAGTTYRAYQPSAGREVEMTVIDPAWAGEPGFVSRFEVETQHIGRLQHPHVLPLLDHWRDPGGAYLVTMWLGGGTLAERLARGRLDLEQGTPPRHTAGKPPSPMPIRRASSMVRSHPVLSPSMRRETAICRPPGSSSVSPGLLRPIRDIWLRSVRGESRSHLPPMSTAWVVSPPTSSGPRVSWAG